MSNTNYELTCLEYEWLCYKEEARKERTRRLRRLQQRRGFVNKSVPSVLRSRFGPYIIAL